MKELMKPRAVGRVIDPTLDSTRVSSVKYIEVVLAAFSLALLGVCPVAPAGAVVITAPQERAASGGSCQTASDCGDGIDCTVDSCVNGICSHLADHLFCSDGLACTGPEYCVSGGCDGTFPPYCGLGQSCDEQVDACVGSSCCAPHDSLGCDVPACQSAVCSVKPECCQAGWDLSCAVQAVEVCTSSCSPGPIGFVIVEKTSPVAVAAGLMTYNLHVQFNHPDPGFFGVGSSLITTDDPQGFYQHAFGGNTPPNGGLCIPFPLVCSDSFVTVRLKDSTTICPNGQQCAGNISLDGDFNWGPSQLIGGWFNPNPPNGIGIPDENLQVLIAQFTVHVGYDIFGQLYVVLSDNSGDDLILQSFSTVSTVCPADLNDNDLVDPFDLALLLGAWGPNPGHFADLNGDGAVNAADLAMLLGFWGPC